MRMKLTGPAALLAAAALLSACSTTTSRFEWGGYESALYTYAKKPDRRPDYQKALEAAISRGRATDRVAPGLLAELGYLYLEDGDVGHAIPLFEEEMTRFPESRAFLSAVVTRAKASRSATQEKAS